MQPKLINPYPFVGTKHKEALDFIIANLPADPTFEQLNEILHNAMFPGGTGDPYIAQLLGLYPGMVLPNAYNGYVNNGQWAVDNNQSTAKTSTEPATCNLQLATSSSNI